MNIKTLSSTEHAVLGMIGFHLLPVEDLDKENEFLEAFEVVFNQTLTVTDALGILEITNNFRKVEEEAKNHPNIKEIIEKLIENLPSENIKDIKFFYNVLEVEGKTCNDIVECSK